MPPKTRYKSTTGKGRVNVGKEPKQKEWGANKQSAPPGEKGGGGYVAPSKPKPLVSKPPAPPGEKGGGGTDSGNKTLTTSLLSKKIQNDTVKTKSTNPIKKWVYKGDTKGSQYYKNLPFKKALAAENPFSKYYEGFNPKYKGPNKVGVKKYALEGIKSLGGGSFGNISGGTTGSRYLFEKAAKFGKFFGARANLATAVGIASYDTTMSFFNNTSTGNKIKKNIENVGASIGKTAGIMGTTERKIPSLDKQSISFESIVNDLKSSTSKLPTGLENYFYENPDGTSIYEPGEMRPPNKSGSVGTQIRPYNYPGKKFNVIGE